jgi:hypothetical protein
MTNKKIKAIIGLIVLLGFSLKTHAWKKHFIENAGQITDQFQNKRSDIIAKHNAGNGLNIYLSKSGIHYQWANENEIYRMDVNLIGANQDPKISKEAETDFREQYHLPDINGTAKGFRRIIYHEIYPGIDWVFYFNSVGKLEHDFIVKPGGKVSDIKLQYAGADQVKADRFGNLIATTKYGQITEPAPYSYEQSSKKKVSSSYKIVGNTLTFKTGPYTGTLVIDPVIEWSTYFGGSEYDEIKDVKIGKDSFVYVVGSTNSTTNMATVGAHLTTFQGGTASQGSDAFISKFSTDGSCIWSTYYGGSNIDLGLSLTVDTSGNVYMAGRTNSQTGIATTGSYQQAKAGTASGYDVFLVKFDTSGSPIWGTYFGGTGADGTQSVAIVSNKLNQIYLTGNTQSNNGIATSGAFQPTRPGSEDGFISKFDSNGTLIWGSYFGTTSIDWINGIAVDTSGDIVVTGETMSTTGISTTGAYLEIGNGGRDGFIAKFNAAGQRTWSTYFGGQDYERLITIATDSLNSIYFGGITYSTANIASSNAHQTAIGSTMDGCLGKLDATGVMQWSTYYGGSDNDGITALSFVHDKLYATGMTVSPNNIATSDAIVPVFNNSYSEGMLVTFSSSGQRLWGSYLGGDITDDLNSIAINDQEQIFIGGRTESITGINTTGAHQTNLGGNQDGWLLKIKMCNLPATPIAILGNTVVCENSEQQYTIPTNIDVDSFIWILPNGWTGISSTDTINVTTGANGGTLKAVAINICGASDTVFFPVTVNPAPVPTISRSSNILSVSQNFSTYQWLLNGGPITGATDPTHVIVQNGTYTLKVTGNNGCAGLSNEISVTDHTSINELENLGIKIYPNPFNEQLSITAPMKLRLLISDLSGKIIYKFEVPEGYSEIELGNLSNGNYLFNVYNSNNGKPLGNTTLVKFSK